MCWIRGDAAGGIAMQHDAKTPVYLAGKITGDPYYFTKFLIAEQKLENLGYAVFNPARLPQECLPWLSYMRICFAMIDECSAVFFLLDWRESRGATWEYGYAVAKGKTITFFENDKKGMPSP